MTTVREHYDALGSALHIPTLAQAEKGGIDFERLRARCNDVISFLEAVLASPIHNVKFGHSAMIDCMNCGKPLRRWFALGTTERKVECLDCKADTR
jgi:hypothetical protein